MAIDKNLEFNIRKLLGKIKQSKVSDLELEVGDFILTCDSKEEMQRYIRWGKVIEKTPQGVVLKQGYNINLVSESKAEILRVRQNHQAANDHFGHKLDPNEVYELPHMIKYFEITELQYLNDCL